MTFFVGRECGLHLCSPLGEAGCSCKETGHSLTVDCSNKGLNSVPKLPGNITRLILDRNGFKNISRDSFTGLSNLVFLSMKFCNLTDIDSSAFEHLTSLKELDLFGNNLMQNDSWSESLFLPLANSLKSLDIRMNQKNPDPESGFYPLPIVTLKKLEELKMDLIRNQPLPVEYGGLSRLQRLMFAKGRSRLGFVADDTFDAVSALNITEVNLSDLNVAAIGPQALSKLPHLRILDLSHNQHLNMRFWQIIPSLHNTSLKVLVLSNIGFGLSPTSYTRMIANLSGIGLEKLYLDHNAIGQLYLSIRAYFPKLKVLSLAQNAFMRLGTQQWLDICSHPNLQGLNFSYQNSFKRPRRKRSPKKLNTWNDCSQQSSKTSEECALIKVDSPGASICQEDMACPFPLPPKLEWADFSHFVQLGTFIPEMILMKNNSLKRVWASHGGIERLRYPIYCAPHVVPQIATFDLRSNNIFCVNSTTFEKCNWGEFRHLYLGANNLGIVEQNTCNADKTNIIGFLKPLRNLETLDLSDNKLESTKLLGDLEQLTELRVLDLSSNQMHNFSLNLENLTKLEMLDLSNNNLRCLSRKSMLQFYSRQSNRRKQGIESELVVNLMRNTLACSCDCLDFLSWIPKSGISFKNQEQYQCLFNDGRKMSFRQLPEIIIELEAQCFGMAWLHICISAQLGFCCFTVLCTVLYRRKHDIRYLYLKFRLNRNRLRRLLSETTYTYSAFISCHRREAGWFVMKGLLPTLETEETKLKFCVAQRNFRAGVTIMNNIIKTVQQSHKVVCVVSQDFLLSGWCKEELLIAHQVRVSRP